MTTLNPPIPNVRPSHRMDPPPLANGDRMDREEFERRFDATPGLKYAELIHGVVYMSPLRDEHHGEPHASIVTWLGYYVTKTPGLKFSSCPSVRLGVEDMPQPDVLLRIPENRGGQSRRTKDGYLEGPPELIAEVSASSTSLDLNEKLELYRDRGVKEYIVWRVLEDSLDWFFLESGRYVPIRPDGGSLFKSRTFPGLWLDARALLSGELARVFEVVDQGVAQSDHASFAAQLAENRRGDAV